MKRRPLAGLIIVALGLGRLPLGAQEPVPLKPFLNEDGTPVRRALPVPRAVPVATPVPRAVPVGEAMVACVLADHLLRDRAQNPGLPRDGTLPYSRRN